MDSQILDGMAKAYWADAWASQMEEMQLSGHLSGMEIMDVMPQELPAKAMEIAKKLYAEIEKDNNIKLEDFTPPGEEDFDKDLFGHYLAMEAMGHGVGWSDDHEDHGLEIPYVEESYELWDDAIAAIKAEYGDEAKEPEQEESVRTRNNNLTERDAESAYAKAVEKVMKKYTPRIEKIMNEIKAVLEHAGYSVVGPDFMDADEYSWWMTVMLEEGKESEQDIDIQFEIAESEKFEGTLDGINFVIDITERGGRMLGGLNPHNYSDEVWVSLKDPKAIEERFKILEDADPNGVLNVVETEGHMDHSDQEESVKANAKDLIESVMRGKNPKVVVDSK